MAMLRLDAGLSTTVYLASLHERLNSFRELPLLGGGPDDT